MKTPDFENGQNLDSAERYYFTAKSEAPEPVAICPSCGAEGEYQQVAVCDRIGFEVVYRCPSCDWQVDARGLSKIQARPCFLCEKWAFGDNLFCDDCQEKIDDYYSNFSLVVIGNICSICGASVSGKAALCPDCNGWQNELEADYRAEQDQARMPL